MKTKAVSCSRENRVTSWIKYWLPADLTETNTFTSATLSNAGRPTTGNQMTQKKKACLPYLYRQIELVNPEIIILLGATALKGLIDPDARITRLRGQWIAWENRQVMSTYHPSALLRNQELKRPVWDDFKQVVSKYRELIDPGHQSAYC